MDPILKSLKAVSEEIRMRILMLLIDREACVCELMEVFGMAQSKLSHHLITLRKAGLLQDEKRGKWHYYRVDTSALSKKNSEVISLLSGSLGGNKSISNDRRTFLQVRRRNIGYVMNIACCHKNKKTIKGACPR